MDIINKSDWLDWASKVIEKNAPPPTAWINMNIILTEATYNHVVFKGAPENKFMNPNGNVQGGWIASILDASLSGALISTLSEKQTCSTLELKVNYLKSINKDSGELFSTGKIVSKGSRIALVEARLENNNGDLFAYSTSTCIIIGKGK